MSVGGNQATLQVQKWVHLPKQIPATATKQKLAKACTVCTACQKWSATAHKCDKCEVSLHGHHCFKNSTLLKTTNTD